MFAAAFALVFAQAASSGAWSSVRPPECAPLDVGRLTNVWERAKAPELHRYCDLLASGAAKLAGTAPMRDLVVDIARRADRTYPGHAAPYVLEGRALEALGRFPRRWTRSRGRRRKTIAHSTIPSRSTGGRVSWPARTSSPKAESAYRELLPRSATLSLAERSAASFEAGMLAMGRGPGGLDEAVPILREAIRGRAGHRAHGVGAGARARARPPGETAEARALLDERVRADPRPLLGGARAKELFAPRWRTRRTRSRPSRSKQRHRKPRRRKASVPERRGTGPWAEHARSHLNGGGRAR